MRSVILLRVVNKILRSRTKSTKKINLTVIITTLYTMMSTKEGVRAAARWMVRADTLHQFSLARVQARRVDGHEEEVYE